MLLTLSIAALSLVPGPQRVALVTGASRGIGKGIAVELGRSGYCVHCVGRSSRTAGQTTERAVAADAGELTVEATAEAVSAAGGRGIAVAADLSEQEAIDAVVKRVRSDEGRLDVLVCSAFTTPPALNNAGFRDDFWKQGATMWDAVHGVGLRSVFLLCCAAAPLMIETAAAAAGQGTPLMALISSFGGKAYTFNVPYGVGKAAVDRLAGDMALQLKRHGVATTALYPGVVRTEGNLEMDARGEWELASGGLDLAAGETPAYTGRALTSLLALGDEALLERSGRVEVVAELARELDFTDVDGRQPPSIRSLAFILPEFVFPQIEAESGKPLPLWLYKNVPDVLLPWSVFTSGPPPTANQE